MELAIRGDKKRGQEIVELFKMLGGKNTYSFAGRMDDHYYHLDDYNRLCVFGDDTKLCVDGNWKLFSLDGFLKEFPYKIGDTVRVDSHISGDLTIKRMMWSEQQATVLYGFNVPDENNIEWVCIEDIKPINKQTTMNIAEILKDAPRGTKLYSPICGECRLIKVSEDGEFVHVRNNDEVSLLTLNKYGKSYWKDSELLLFPSATNRDWSTFKVESQFPTTLRECHLSLEINEIEKLNKKIAALNRLIDCRDAWWKVDNNWKPDWSENNYKYVINTCKDTIDICVAIDNGNILAFRTPTIRNKFLDTFRDLIEQCKELI